jgi:hypothetical protein
VNSSLQKFLKKTLRLCVRLNRVSGVERRLQLSPLLPIMTVHRRLPS